MCDANYESGIYQKEADHTWILLNVNDREHKNEIKHRLSDNASYQIASDQHCIAI